MLVEVCANSLESALNAQRAGADRIELCVELGVGGITPSYGLIKSVRDQLNIPIRVLIRPRSGDFTYSNEEFKVMLHDIELCKELGCDGIVSGVLKKDLSLDMERSKLLIEATAELNFTFHRAFDWVEDPFDALTMLEDLGVECILSSGQQRSAIEGINLLAELHHKANRCSIMPGGGIRLENIQQFKAKGFKIAHLSATRMHKTLKQEPIISMNSFSYLREDQVAISHFETIEAIVKSVK